MHSDDQSRRAFLKIATVGAVGVAGMPYRAAWARAPFLPTPAPSSVRLGVASYSLRQLSRTDAIAAILALHARYVNIKSFHQPYESTPDELAAGRSAFEDAGLEIVGGGTITLQQDDDDDIRSYFEYAKLSGMPLMVIAPTPQTLPRIERFVMEYDIKVAVHNHGPEDAYFPGPQDVLPVIRDMDPRVGVCVDVGHTTRTGIDIVEAIELAGARVLDIHMKDLADLSVRESQCIVGEGAMPIPAIFRQLEKMSYRGYVNLEYEIDADDPLPGMKQSFAYMRGVLAGLQQS
jgi:sugar phosphate isomerase/epimerase